MAPLPKFVVVQVKGCGWLKHGDANAVVVENGEGVFDPLSKIEVERAKSNVDGCVHLRFCQTNKYWARDAEGWLVANSTKPEEDTSNLSCTLFQYAKEEGFRHVQSGGHVSMTSSHNRMYVVSDPKVDTGFAVLDILDWGTFVKLPKHVAFKGDNGKYLERADDHFLKFTSDDANVDTSGHKVHLVPDGRIHIKSDYFNQFWRWDYQDWIRVDTTDTNNPETFFWPVRIDGTTIALRSEKNQKFCRRCEPGFLGFNPDYLSASAPTIMKEARFTVEELVLSRKVYNVGYRMEDARVYNEETFVAGMTVANNNSDQEASIGVDIQYDESNSYTYSNSESLTSGPKLHVNFSVPFIDWTGVGLKISFTTDMTTEAFQWSDTKTIKKSVHVKGSVPVPAKSSARVKYVGVRGTYDIPFSYTQEDESSTGGAISYNEMTDGVFTGVNSYNFKFKFDEVTPL